MICAWFVAVQSSSPPPHQWLWAAQLANNPPMCMAQEGHPTPRNSWLPKKTTTRMQAIDNIASFFLPSLSQIAWCEPMLGNYILKSNFMHLDNHNIWMNPYWEFFKFSISSFIHNHWIILWTHPVCNCIQSKTLLHITIFGPLRFWKHWTWI